MSPFPTHAPNALVAQGFSPNDSDTLVFLLFFASWCFCGLLIVASLVWLCRIKVPRHSRLKHTALWLCCVVPWCLFTFGPYTEAPPPFYPAPALLRLLVCVVLPPVIFFHFLILRRLGKKEFSY